MFESRVAFFRRKEEFQVACYIFEAGIEDICVRGGGRLEDNPRRQIHVGVRHLLFDEVP